MNSSLTRQLLVDMREERVARREQLAPEVSERALLVAQEAAAVMNTATQLAAHHLVDTRAHVLTLAHR